jgi:Zn finger protein HypA/HybF involved in hydrogenase expression
MGERMAETPVEQKTPRTVQCGHCGAVHRNLPWAPGDTCPKCDSEDLAPLVAKGESDYERADRSSAYSIEDIRFGRLAQWGELASAKQVQFALHQQNQAAKAGQPVPDIGRLLLKEKIIDRRQYDAILAVRRAKPGSKEDTDLGQAAVKLGYVTQDQVNECRRQQVEADEAGRDAVPLALLLVERRLMQENQMLALLKNADRADSGLLHRLRKAQVDETKEQPLERIVGEKGSQLRPVRIALLAALPVALALVWYFILSGPGALATVQCTAKNPNCPAIFTAPADAKFPCVCIECKQKTAWPQAMCKECGATFAVTGLAGYGVSCPKCHSTQFLMVTNAKKNKADRQEISGRLKNKGKPPAPAPRGGPRSGG